MIQLIFIGLFLLVGLILLARWLVTADPRTVAKALRWTAIGGGLLLVLFLALTGRLPVILSALAPLALILMRWRAIANRLKAARGPTPNQRSGLETAYLEVELDHDTGRMDGVVRQGRFAGRTLGSMSQAEVLALLSECRGADPRSVPILEAWLDRQFGPDWRATAGAGGEGATGGRPHGEPPMTKEEAYRILGLSPGADKESIKQAHRRLMMKLHPDLGGSDYLAAKLNEAKDLLLNS